MSRCKNRYVLPIDLKKVTHWHKLSSPAHVGKLKHSLDFLAPEGTQIYAAADGEVVWLRNNSKVGGVAKKYYYMGNRVVLKHKNGEYSAYEHNKYHSARVKIGQKVKRGQAIALVGSTGWSRGPHLHFEVFTNPAPDLSEGETLQVVFKIPRKGRCGRRHV
ncbi:MAG: M23 family metallopeptidase [archaeon]